LGLLGKPADDADVLTFLADYEIVGKPKLKRGEPDASLKNAKRGIEVGVRRASALDVKIPALPPTTLVFWTVRMYGPTHASFTAFGEDLPLGVRFDFGRAELEAHFGKKPGAENADLGMARWDFAEYCVFGRFVDGGKDGGLRSLSIQLPVVAVSP